MKNRTEMKPPTVVDPFREPLPHEGDLKVWHIPQIPGKPFEVPVRSVVEGKFLMDVLAQYDMFQLARNIKPDFCNASGLMIYENEEWVEFQDENGEDVNQSNLAGPETTDDKIKALMVVAQDEKISAFLNKTDPKAMQQVQKALSEEIIYRERLKAHQVVPSHSSAAERFLRELERKGRGRRA